jgi:hypothetical protein
MFYDSMPGEYPSHENRKTVFFNNKDIMAGFLVRVLPNKNTARLYYPSRPLRASVQIRISCISLISGEIFFNEHI